MTRQKMRMLCYHAPTHDLPALKTPAQDPNRRNRQQRSSAGSWRKGLVLRTAYWRIVQALLMGVSLTAQSAEGVGRDPFDTERYVPKAPGEMWLPPSALSQVPEPEMARLKSDRPLTLPELTELALQNNPRTRQAWYAARAQAAGIGLERADDLPQISADISWQRSESGSQTGNQNPWLTRYGPAVTLSYLLYDFGVGDNRVLAAEYQALAAALSQNRVLQDVVFQVEQAYYRYLGFEALVRSNE